MSSVLWPPKDFAMFLNIYRYLKGNHTRIGSKKLRPATVYIVSTEHVGENLNSQTLWLNLLSGSN